MRRSTACWRSRQQEGIGSRRHRGRPHQQLLPRPCRSTTIWRRRPWRRRNTASPSASPLRRSAGRMRCCRWRWQRSATAVVLDCARKITLTVDPALDAMFPSAVPARVEVGIQARPLFAHGHRAPRRIEQSAGMGRYRHEVPIGGARTHVAGCGCRADRGHRRLGRRRSPAASCGPRRAGSKRLACRGHARNAGA